MLLLVSWTAVLLFIDGLYLLLKWILDLQFQMCWNPFVIEICMPLTADRSTRVNRYCFVTNLPKNHLIWDIMLVTDIGRVTGSMFLHLNFPIDVITVWLIFQVKAEDVNGRVDTILEELRATRNEVSSLRSKIAVLKAASLASKATTVEPHNVRYLL